jgi:hypothetical protein
MDFLARLAIIVVAIAIASLASTMPAAAQCTEADLTGCLPDLSNAKRGGHRSVDPVSGMRSSHRTISVPGFFVSISSSTAKNDSESKNTVYTRSAMFHARALAKDLKRDMKQAEKGSFKRRGFEYRYQFFTLQDLPGGCASAVGRAGEMPGWGWKRGTLVMVCSAEGMSEPLLWAVVDMTSI